MALTITETSIRSDLTDVHADFRPAAAADGNGAWVVIYGDRLDPVPDYYGRLLTREQAIAAVTAAEDQAQEVGR